MADGNFLPRVDLPRVDPHSHAGRCFLAGLPAGHPAVTSLGAASIADALRAALTPYADAEGVHLDAAVWLVQAVAP